MLFVSSMTIKEQMEIRKSHKRILVDTGFYTKEEIEMYLADLENEKFFNLQDAISPNFYKKLYKKYFTIN